MEEIRQGVEKYLKCTVTIGLGTPIGRLVDAKEAYDSAAQALDYRLLLGNNRVILIGDVEQRTPTPAARFDELKQQALMRCIKVGTEPELLTIISELFRELSDTGGTVMDLQLYLLELVTAIFRVAKEVGTAIEQVPSSETSLFAQIDRFQNLEEAKHWAVHVSIRLMRQIASERRSTQRSLIEQAKEYVKGHYADPELSVQKLCGELYISAGYFSGLFKKETRQTFVAYLQQFRMEIAKELLCTTDMKAFEIAEKAGYADPNYFSFSFKKLYGISPKEYRSSARVPVDE
ncbi:AraC family transcriptional regulator, partial [Paenibacillus sepulcri]|nr:AraC family transcriptional regulator [Paenibacillus sepulcri]